MPTAFVITPFADVYLDRYKQVFKPALEAAGLTPKTVGEDPNKDGIVDKIHEMIRDADVVFAELSEDNANVWYELGYAQAAGKPLVMVCHGEIRKKLPFDIAHREVLFYTNQNPKDFLDIREKIEEKAKVKLNSEQRFKALAANLPVASTDGLSPIALAALGVIMGEAEIPTAGVETRSYVEKMESFGFTPVGAKIALMQVEAAGLAETFHWEDSVGYDGYSVKLTDEGVNWIVTHSEKFQHQVRTPAIEYDRNLYASNDVPF